MAIVWLDIIPSYERLCKLLCVVAAVLVVVVVVDFVSNKILLSILR